MPVAILSPPAVYLIDENGDPITVDDGDALGSAEAIIVAGSDGTNARFVRVASDGTVRTDPTGTTTQPVSAAALPLPAGASTEATLALIKAKTDNLDVALSTRAVTGLTDTQLRATAVPVSASSLPLPSGAATQTTLADILTELGQKLETSDFQARINTLGQKTMANSSPVVISSDQSSIPVSVSGSAARSPAVVSSGNSTTSVLAGGAAFTGTWEEVLPYAVIGVLVSTSHVSATDGLSLQYSSNGSDVDDSDSYTVSAGSKYIGVPPEARYFRVVYTNGATLQTSFRLQTLLHPFYTKPSSHNIADALPDGEQDAELVRAIITGQKSGGSYVNAAFDDQGRLIVAPAGASSSTSGFSFGQIALSAIGYVTVRKTALTEQTSNAQRSIVSSNANDSSAGTGSRQVKITYYTSAGVGPSTETVTMNGTTAVNTVATDICFVEKLEVVSVGSTGSNVGTISLKAATAGGGATVMSISATDLRTYLALHYVPTGKTCYVTSLGVGSDSSAIGQGGEYILRAQVLGVSTAPNAQLSDFIRLYGQSSQTIREYGTPIEVVGPSRIQLWVNPISSNNVIFNGSFDFYEQ